jgi:16S rRNA G966 N2-methylase RsmD
MKVSNIPVKSIKVSTRLRNLNMDKVDELSQSIEILGLLNPLTITTDNVLISGNHRLESFKQLGKDVIPCKIVDFDEYLIQLAEIDENIIRNNLNDIELGEHLIKRDNILEKLGMRYVQGDNQHTGGGATISPPPVSTKDISKSIGVSERTTQLKKSIVKHLHPDVRDTLRNSQFANNTTGLLKLSRLDEETQMKVSNRLSTGKDTDIKASIKEVIKSQKKDDLIQKMGTYQDTDYDGLQLICGDFRDVCEGMEDGSIDMIFTDAPYHRDYLYLYEDLARVSNRLLKDGGSVLCYLDTGLLPQVLDVMSKHLTYHWLISVRMMGNKGRNGRGIFIEYKPILWFVKGDKIKRNEYVSDFIKSSIPTYNKILHPWEQSPVESEYYIKYLTNVGGVVMDCMMGTGTTGIASLTQGRNFIGIEQDKDTFNIARKRIYNELKSIPYTKP